MNLENKKFSNLPNSEPEISDQEIREYIKRYGWDRNYSGWGPKRNNLTWEDAHKAIMAIKKTTLLKREGWLE